MSLAVLIYNLLMTVADAAALFWLGRRNSAGTFVRLGLLEALVAVALAGALGSGSFGALALLACALFLHAVVFLLGAAAVLRRECPRTALSAVLLALVLAGVAGDAFLIEPKWLEVSHLRLSTAKLSRPVRIAVVADLQTDAFGSYEQEALRRVVEEKPDLILLAGDYVQAESPRREEIRSEIADYLRQIGFAAPLGVFAVQGNCDGGPWQETFAGVAVTAVDRTRSFQLGELELTCLSAHDSFDAKLTIPAAEAGRYHVVLGHSPDFALGQVDADLLVAGHTHGGQVRLPWLGPVVTLSRVPRAWAAGLTELTGGGKLLVSRGIGMERGPAPRLRFLCRPELVIMDLEPGIAESPRAASGPATRVDQPAKATAPASGPATRVDQPAKATAAASGPATRADQPAKEAPMPEPFEKLVPLHKKLGRPQPGDWLAEHPEPGQTYHEYVRSQPVKPDGGRRTIYVQPLGSFTATQRKIISRTAEYLGLWFDLPVNVREDVPLASIPAKARRIHPVWKDPQILSTYVLEEVLAPQLPKDAAVYIAFTTSDLWPGEGWNFVFGQASLEDRVGVWSIYRYGDPDESQEAYRRCLLRTLKVGTHEAGHMFSMAHCTAYAYAMNGSNHLAEMDRRPAWLCPECLAKLCWATGADPAKRFERRAGFCRADGLEPQREFFQKSLAALGGR